ncbi:Scarecrow-like protein 9, partial [Dichanthelium oligosanthes]
MGSSYDPSPSPGSGADDDLFLYLSDLGPTSPSAYLDLPPTPHHEEPQPPEQQQHTQPNGGAGAAAAPEDMVLPFISRMLMEEDIDDKFFYEYPDHPALLQAQQPFLDILSDDTSSSPTATTHSGSSEEEVVVAAPGGVGVGGGGGRGRKNRFDDEELDFERSSKQSALQGDGDDRDIFEKYILTSPEMCTEQMEKLRIAMQEEAAKKEAAGGNGKSKAKGSRRGGREVVDLRTLLIHCAQAVASDDRRSATEMLKQIKQHASPQGDAMQRLAHCFAEGLQARVAGTGSMVEGGPPEVRITGIDLPQPGFRPTQRIEETGRRLSKYAQEFGVSFKYQVIAASKMESIRAEDLNLDPEEVLIVNCIYQFKNLMDESVLIESPRDAVLNNIRKMRPHAFIHAIVNGSFSAPFFVTRFREALFYYSALFDVLDTTTPRDNNQRMLIEQNIFGRAALNVIACEGTDRVERPETYKQWQ